MEYTNSPLAHYKPLGKNYYSTRKSILGIVPHVVVGHGSAQNVWDWFKSINNASCNYFIDDNGGIWCFVDEKHSAWTTSSDAIDMTHVTVEIASDTAEPYKITDKAYESLIRLTADVYKRNGLEKCYWAEDKRYDLVPGGVPMHRNYSTKGKSCPGNYLVSKYRSGDFCERVNALLYENEPVNNNGIKYIPHVQGIGWMEWMHDGQVAGTTGMEKRLEAIRIDTSAIPDLKLTVHAHIQGEGWKTFKDITPDTIIGTIGQGKRLEAIAIVATGLPEGTNLYYQLHVQSIGWMFKEKSPYATGTISQSLRAEAIKIWVE